MTPEADRPLAPLPLAPEARVRIRATLRAQARQLRLRLAEGALHAGFALGALAWAAVAALG